MAERDSGSADRIGKRIPRGDSVKALEVAVARVDRRDPVLALVNSANLCRVRSRAKVQLVEALGSALVLADLLDAL